MLLQAHTLGLVDDIGLQRVVDSACNDLRWARARYASQTSINWDRVIQQLNKDIIAANDFLPDDKQVDTHAHTERLPHNAAAAVAILSSLVWARTYCQTWLVMLCPPCHEGFSPKQIAR